MSVKLMTMAWETDAKANELLVLLAMCDFSSDEGVCYPSKATVSKKAKVGTTTCKHIMGAYEDIGLWKSEKRTRDNGSSTSNVFIIDLNKLKNLDYAAFKLAFQARKKYTPSVKKKSQCDPLDTGHNVTPQSHNVTPQSTNCDPLEPSTFNHHIEPSKKINKKSSLTSKSTMTWLEVSQERKALIRGEIKKIEEPHFLSLEDFENALEAKGYKYKSFVAAYRQWLSSAKKRGNGKVQNNVDAELIMQSPEQMLQEGNW